MFHAESDCCQEVHGHDKEYEIFQFGGDQLCDGWPVLGHPRVSTLQISHAIRSGADAVGGWRLPGAFTLPQMKRPSALARMLGLSADARQPGQYDGPRADVGFSANTGRKSAHLGTSACSHNRSFSQFFQVERHWRFFENNVIC